MKVPNLATSVIMGVLIWIGDALAVSTLSSPRNRRPGIDVVSLDLPVPNSMANELVDHHSTGPTIRV